MAVASSEMPESLTLRVLIGRIVDGHAHGRDVALDFASGGLRTSGILLEHFKQVCAFDIQSQLGYRAWQEGVRALMAGADRLRLVYDLDEVLRGSFDIAVFAWPENPFVDDLLRDFSRIPGLKAAVFKSVMAEASVDPLAAIARSWLERSGEAPCLDAGSNMMRDPASTDRCDILSDGQVFLTDPLPAGDCDFFRGLASKLSDGHALPDAHPPIGMVKWIVFR